MKQLDIIVHKDEDTGQEISWGITHDDGSVKWYDTRYEANYYFSDVAVSNDDVETEIIYCDECGQASGYVGEPPTNMELSHSDTCFYNVMEEIA